QVPHPVDRDGPAGALWREGAGRHAEAAAEDAGPLMTQPVRTIVAFDSGIERGRVEAVLSSCSGIHVHSVVESLEDGWMAPPEGEAELLVVACSDSEAAPRFIREAVEADSERPVVVLYQG